MSTEAFLMKRGKKGKKKKKFKGSLIKKKILENRLMTAGYQSKMLAL
jgi:hypothetical protein